MSNPITHFATSAIREENRDPVCGYIDDSHWINADPDLVTCPECLDWIEERARE
jgi:hypothetical protein